MNRPTEEYSRGRETSDALVEVRTVLSRAETALETLDKFKAWSGGDRYGRHYDADPEIDEMVGARPDVTCLT